jgi:RND family efflux transporter MFP subunit
MKYLVILLTVMISSCQSATNHGHAHDAEGNHIGAQDETPRVEATIWTNKTELFVEYPVLIVGETSRFAAHLTILEGHQAVSEGTVTVSLIKGKKGIRQKVDVSASLGIFKPSLKPEEAGVSQLVFDLKTPSISDRIVIQNVVVYESIEQAEEQMKIEESANAITFLKEQAWKIEFETAPVVFSEVYDVIQTYGVWKVAPSDAKSLIATASGQVTYQNDDLTEGKKVKKGDVLLTISSSELTENNLDAEIKQAHVNLEQAKVAYQRKKQLYESKIVPKSEFEKVEQEYLIAKSNYETLKAGYSGNGKQVSAPFDGYVKAISKQNGDFVNQGDALVTIVAQSSSRLETYVGISYAQDVQSIQNIWYQPKNEVWSDILSTGGELISIGKSVKKDQPMLMIYANVNEMVDMPEGAFTPVQIQIGSATKNNTIPVMALLEDYGKFSVIVQLSGESFERREVIIGRKNGNEVEIISGLSEGEVVVTKGAYQVKMASMSGQAPAHGHAH